MKRWFSSLLVGLFIAAGLGSPAAASEPTATLTCTQLAKQYPSGVAKSKAAAAKAYGAGFARPAVAAAVYKANAKRLDRDGDGLMCGSKRANPAAQANLCEKVDQGFTYVPGATSVPIAIQIANRSATTDAGRIAAEISLVNDANVIISTQRTFVDGIAAGQTSWAATEVYIRSSVAPSVSAVTARVAVTCSPSAKFTRPGLNGPGSAVALSAGSTTTRLEATVQNTTGVDIAKGTGIQFVAFDAQGRPIAGDSTALSAAVPSGMGIMEHVTIPAPAASQIASVQFFLDPA